MLRPEDRKEFGRYLKGLREAKDKKLREVQRDCQISPGYLSLIESGERNPPNTEFLKKLALYYGAPMAEVMRRAGRGHELDPQVLEEDRIRRAFSYVINDTRFTTGHSLTGEQTVETMRFVVEMYQNFTGLNLLDERLEKPTPTDVEE